MSVIREDVKSFLGINVRLPDKVLLETLRRRLDDTPMRECNDKADQISICMNRYGEEFSDIFSDYEDLFKV